MNETTCIWKGAKQPRALNGRHTDDCDTNTCRGCRPCPERHCRICGREHVTVDGRGDDQACAACIGETRADLVEIGRLVASLPGEAATRGVEHEAMALIGPAADPEARGHLEASIAAGRIPADYLETADNDQHPLFVLGTWDMVWRDAYAHGTDERISVGTAIAYLGRNLARAANDPNVDYETFVTDLQACRRHLEQVLHDGEQIERGAPCWHCNAPMVRVWGNRAADDHWRCSKTTCAFEVTDLQYRGWVEEDAIENASSLNATAMERRTGVKATTVRIWGSRGLIRKAGTDHRGLTLYDVADVETRRDAGSLDPTG